MAAPKMEKHWPNILIAARLHPLINSISIINSKNSRGDTCRLVYPIMLLFIQDWVRTTEGYVPIPIRKVAAKESRCEVLIMSSSQPTAEDVNAPARRMPRDFRRSDNHPRKITDTPAQAYTGMVIS